MAEESAAKGTTKDQPLREPVRRRWIRQASLPAALLALPRRKSCGQQETSVAGKPAHSAGYSGRTPLSASERQHGQRHAPLVEAGGPADLAVGQLFKVPALGMWHGHSVHA